MTDIPDDLIMLERCAEEARAHLAGLTGEKYEAQWHAWRAASEALRAAITERARETGEQLPELEQAVQRAARHAQEDPAVE
ncbi:hypothetical protein [Streptomyces sp. NPDC086787]|uniref:hypothetical protein n=1 Tax=Streptomyces sp. NPDC086787 TaxID=3365759 RepID=UPI0037F8CC55